ncbi:MAG: glycoside hydrolase family 2 protein [Chloroflexota bacterium]
MTLAAKQSLSGEWQFRQAGSEAWMSAVVPGGVHTDLLHVGAIADPFVGDEEKRTQWVAEQDWEYRRTLTVDGKVRAQERIYLVCDGIDTLAEVRLNGRVLGEAENMFRRYRWDVTQALQAGENELRVLFRSSVCYAVEQNRILPMPDVNDALPGAPYVRKAPSHFGWDWGPKLPAIGIWRDIRLEGYTTARLSDVSLRQKHTNGQVTVTAAVKAEVLSDLPLWVTLHLTAPDGKVQTTAARLEDGRQTVALTVDQPQLWWPNGYGAQPLYRVDVRLASVEVDLDEWTYQVGLRTIELRQEPDEWGKSFTFVVNGVPLFAQGSNWIPADSFPTRVTHAQLEHLIGSAVSAHHNMVRIWGGGYYEDDYFYDLCDRHGLLVWQDFMFACAGYPLEDADFLENVKGEVVDNVRRLRHRASLALWCGNNEVEAAWVDWGWNKPENADLMRAYEQFFYKVLPRWVETEDPDHPYWASSPSSGLPMIDPNSVRSGDVHQWAVWHANKPFSHYRETPARFVSEFGFESVPALSTVAAFAEPADWNITSYIMEHHQRSPVGNEKIVVYLLENFRMPKDFSSLVYLSQLLQAEAMRVGVEFWRRHPACSGALYWQLNDCWPVISWSGIDYYGRWKAMHYSSRRFFTPLLLAIEENGTAMQVFATNASRQESWTGQLRWSLETLQGEQLDGGEEDVSVDPLATVEVRSLDFAKAVTEEKRRRTIFVCELWSGGERVQSAVATFAPTKHLALEEPGLSVDVEQSGPQVTIKVQSRSLARFVELALEGSDVLFSDNYFDLPANRAVEVTCPLPDGMTLEQVRSGLRVRSVFDSF